MIMMNRLLTHASFCSTGNVEVDKMIKVLILTTIPYERAKVIFFSTKYLCKLSIHPCVVFSYEPISEMCSQFYCIDVNSILYLHLRLRSLYYSQDFFYFLNKVFSFFFFSLTLSLSICKCIISLFSKIFRGEMCCLYYLCCLIVFDYLASTALRFYEFLYNFFAAVCGDAYREWSRHTRSSATAGR